jgi:hypothetical protein
MSGVETFPAPTRLTVAFGSIDPPELGWLLLSATISFTKRSGTPAVRSRCHSGNFIMFQEATQVLQQLGVDHERCSFDHQWFLPRGGSLTFGVALWLPARMICLPFPPGLQSMPLVGPCGVE